MSSTLSLASKVIYFLAFIFFICQVEAVVSPPYDFFGSRNTIKPRQLKAATRNVASHRRSLEISLGHDLELHYLDDSSDGGLAALAAGVQLTSKLPVLMLEDIEHLVDGIHCRPAFMDLHFGSKQHLETARRSLKHHTKFMVITSHLTCNDDGSRLPYIVYDYWFLEDWNIISMLVEPVSWKETFKSFTISFDREDNELVSRSEQYGLHRRNNKISRKRQASLSSQIVSSTIVGTPTLTSLPFPTPTNDPASLSTTIVKDVSAYYSGPVIPSNNTLIGAAEGAFIPAGLTVSCANCSTGGTIELLSGSFTMGSTTSNTSTNIIQFIDHGFAQVVTNGLFAHMALDSTWLPSLAQNFTINLAQIPLQPFSIPDIAVVGPLFNPQIILAAEVDAMVDFQYGFEVSVPDGSSATVNIGNISQSQITGFDNTKFNMLPFQAAVPSIELNLTATFQPQLLIGFSFLDSLGSAGGGIFLQMPQLYLSIAQVSGTNVHCEPLTSSPTINGIAGEIFGNLTHIVPQVEFAAGFIVEATLGAGFPGIRGKGVGTQTAYTPVATAFTGPTACLAFDKDKGGYFTATPTPTASPSAGGTGTEPGQALGTTTPKSEGAALSRESGFFGLRGACVALAVVLGGFLVL